MKMGSNFLNRVPSLFLDLSKAISGDIDCSITTLTKYSRDYSPYSIQPQAIIFPKTTTDIKHVLSFAREYKMPVTVRGSGTGSLGGALGEGIILDLGRYFNHMRNVSMLENTVTVDAGVTLGELSDKLHGWNFELPFLTKGDRETTIGALIATKSSQTGSFAHGSIREWIEGLTVVVDNGEEHIIHDGITPSGRLLGIYQSIFPLLVQETPNLRAAKPKLHDDSTGYNLWSTSIGPRQLIDQLTGSEGTLGIITSVTLHVRPLKKHLQTTFIPVTDKKLLPVFIDIAKHHQAEHIFFYDEAFMQLSERYHPTLTPFFVDTQYALAVTHTSNDVEKLHKLVQSFKKALPVEEHFLKSLEGDSVLKRITGSTFLLSLFDQYTSETLAPISTANGNIVANHTIPSFLDELESYLNSLGKIYSITGNIGSGHISVTTLFDPQSKNYEEDILSYTSSILSLVKDYNGGISAVEGEGLSRTPFISYAYNDVTQTIFRKIKEAWDPLFILNPGKKTGTGPTYLKQRTSRSRPTKN